MNATSRLHDLGQSLWLDQITRQLLDDGGLARYIRDYSITGLTSNPSIFDAAIGDGDTYDAAIAAKSAAGLSGEALFTELALEDLRRAADMFFPVFNGSDSLDGWVSMELSPLLADDAGGSVAAAQRIHQQAKCPNLFVKIPGTPAGVGAIEESIFRGVPINVTLLFSPEQYLASAEAYLRGMERRIAAGLSPRVNSVASVFVSRWDKAVAKKVPAALRNKLGIAIAQRTYRSYRELLATPRWQKFAGLGVPLQRLLWGSTGTKDPDASETLYVEALAAPDTINTLPEKTLQAWAKQGGEVQAMPEDGGDCEQTLLQFSAAGIDLDALASQLQREGAEAFVKSWHSLLARIADKSRRG
jgi:transaldolase